MGANKQCIFFDTCNHVDCDKWCLKKYKLDYLYDEAGIPENRRKHLILYTDADGTDLDAFKRLQSVEERIVDFVKNGENLYIHSVVPGNGKTSWALRLVEDYFNQIWFDSDLECRALFIHVPSFFISLKDNINKENEHAQHIKECFLDADIVIWDDIGTKVITPFEAEHLLSMVDSRMNLNKTNIFTSNMPEMLAADVLGDRLYSRICNASHNIHFKGKDKRGNKYGK